jgi:hypothetical protein
VVSEVCQKVVGSALDFLQSILVNEPGSGH